MPAPSRASTKQGGARSAAAKPPVGPAVGQLVAVSSPSGSVWFNRRELRAGETLGVTDDEAQALALAKTRHRDTAVIPAEGRYFVYAVRGASDLDLELVYGGNAGIRMEAGVLALVNDKGLVYRAQDLARSQEHSPPASGASADPFSAYRGLHADRGGLEALAEPELLATFEAAMFDTALAVLARGEAQARAKAQQLGTRGATSADEHAQLEATGQQVLTLQTQLEQVEHHIGVIRSTPVDQDTHDLPPGWLDELPKLQAQQQQLTSQKQQKLLDYPMLGRYRSARELKDFLAKPALERERALGGDARAVTADILATRANLQAGELNLWDVPSVVDATMAGLGLSKDSPQRKRIQHKASVQHTKETVLNLAMTVFSIGFGLAGAFLSGGASLAFTAGAVGLGAYDAITTTQDFFVKNAAANTDLDPDGGLLPSDARMHWGWLVVAWAGVALDFADVMKAARVAEEVGQVARGRKSITQAAEALAHGDRKLLERLRRAAGDTALTDTISEALRPSLASRVGTEILVDGNLGSDVRIIYQVGEGGRTAVQHLKVGPGAKVADILAHTDTIRLLDRYSGLTGKARQLWDRMRSFAGLGKAAKNPFQAGSKAFESWHELEKLERLISYRRGLLTEMLQQAPDATAAQVALRKELAFLENELDVHERVVAGLVSERGAGSIAMSDATRDALSNGHRLPDFPAKAADELTAEELKRSAYYFERAEDGSFVMKEKLDRAGGLAQPAQVTKAAAKLSDAAQHAKSVAGSTVKDALKTHVLEPADLAAAEARLRPEVERAATEAYEKAIADGHPVKKARAESTTAARNLAREQAIEVAKEAAAARARKAIADGTAFDPAQLDADTAAQLARSRSTPLDAHRLAPKLVDKKDAEFLSLMAEEVSTGRVPPPRTISIGGPPPQPMTMWEYPDGTVVRYKPQGDKRRMAPSYSVEVKANPSLPDAGPESTAFKMDQAGRAAPKNDKQILNPYSRGSHSTQFKAFEDEIMQAVHFVLR